MSWLRPKVVRTCVLCGERWELPRALAGPYRPGKASVGYRGRSGRSGRPAAAARSGDRATLRPTPGVSPVERERELRAMLRQCPGCGSGRFRQMRA
ncbi:MAG: hypothetical protein ACRDYD_13800 [Acidimicrobiales bacterium]